MLVVDPRPEADDILTVMRLKPGSVKHGLAVSEARSHRAHRRRHHGGKRPPKTMRALERAFAELEREKAHGKA